MKNLLIYWVIGCFVIGMPLGSLITECPKAKLPVAEVVGYVAVWPVVFAMVLSRIGQPPLPKTGCDGPPQ
jgi:hypothetical protein